MHYPLKKTNFILVTALIYLVCFGGLAVMFLMGFYDNLLDLPPLAELRLRSYYFEIGSILFLIVLPIMLHLMLRRTVKSGSGKTDAGVTISSEGIYERTHPGFVGLIKWADIKGFHIKKTMAGQLILVMLNNPGDYIAKIKNTMIAQTNMKEHATPAVIITRNLPCTADELLVELQSGLAKYRN